MKKHFTVAVIASCIMTAGCNSAMVKETFDKAGASVGQVAGGLLGGAVGVLATEKIDNDAARLAIIAAAGGIGAYIGSEFEKALTKKDQEQLFSAQQQTATSGKPVRFRGENGAKGSVRVVDNIPATRGEKRVAVRARRVDDTRPATAEQKKLKDKMDYIPTITAINESHETKSGKLNVRVGPGTSYRPVSSLSKGDVVMVLGSVQPTDNWVAVSNTKGGEMLGYAYRGNGNLVPTEKLVQYQDAAPNVYETVQVKSNYECKTLQTTVVTEAGEEISKDAEYCQQADGSWKIA